MASAAKRPRILRKDEIMRLMEESEGDSDSETDMLDQEGDGEGWIDSDTEDDPTANNANNEQEQANDDDNNDDDGGEDDDDDLGNNVLLHGHLPPILRNRHGPRTRRVINTFNDCLDEDNYNSIVMPEEQQRLDYNVKINKGM